MKSVANNDVAALRSVPRHEPASRSPERTRLAEALAAAKQTEQAADDARRAIVRAGDAVKKAESTLERARAEIAERREQNVRLLTEAAQKGAPVAPSTAIREARRAESDAADHLDIAKTAAADLRERLPELEEAARHSKNMIVVRVDAVIRNAAERQLQQAKAAEAAYVKQRAVLHFMDCPQLNETRPVHGLVPAPFESHDFWANDARDEAFAEMKEAIDDFLHRQIFSFDAQWNKHEAVLPWIRARAALFTDPDAQLPSD
jgi:hypothetical protein